MNTVAAHDGKSDPTLRTLELEYEDACRERDRLRAARSDFARQLGPLPAAAGISTATIAVFARHVHHSEFLWVALGLLVLLVAVSVLYGSIPAYRHIRAVKQRRLGQPTGDLPPETWYRRMIELERSVYGAPIERNRYKLLPSRRPSDLQDAFDRERVGLYAVQLLFLFVVLALALSQLI